MCSGLFHSIYSSFCLRNSCFLRDRRGSKQSAKYNHCVLSFVFVPLLESTPFGYVGSAYWFLLYYSIVGLSRSSNLCLSCSFENSMQKRQLDFFFFHHFISSFYYFFWVLPSPWIVNDSKTLGFSKQQFLLVKNHELSVEKFIYIYPIKTLFIKPIIRSKLKIFYFTFVLSFYFYFFFHFLYL